MVVTIKNYEEAPLITIWIGGIDWVKVFSRGCPLVPGRYSKDFLISSGLRSTEILLGTPTIKHQAIRNRSRRVRRRRTRRYNTRPIPSELHSHEVPSDRRERSGIARIGDEVLYVGVGSSDRSTGVGSDDP